MTYFTIIDLLQLSPLYAVVHFSKQLLSAKDVVADPFLALSFSYIENISFKSFQLRLIKSAITGNMFAHSAPFFPSVTILLHRRSFMSIDVNHHFQPSDANDGVLKMSASLFVCLSVCLLLGSGSEGVDDLCFHTYGEFSSPSPSLSVPPLDSKPSL